MIYLRDNEPEDDDGGRLLLACIIAVPAGVVLWLGIIALVSWLLSLSTAAHLYIGAGVLLILGSAAIFRGLYEAEQSYRLRSTRETDVASSPSSAGDSQSSPSQAGRRVS